MHGQIRMLYAGWKLEKHNATGQLLKLCWWPTRTYVVNFNRGEANNPFPPEAPANHSPSSPSPPHPRPRIPPPPRTASCHHNSKSTQKTRAVHFLVTPAGGREEENFGKILTSQQISVGRCLSPLLEATGEITALCEFENGKKDTSGDYNYFRGHSTKADF